MNRPYNRPQFPGKAEPEVDPEDLMIVQVQVVTHSKKSFWTDKITGAEVKKVMELVGNDKAVISFMQEESNRTIVLPSRSIDYLIIHLPIEEETK